VVEAEATDPGGAALLEIFQGLLNNARLDLQGGSVVPRGRE
jgi:hypothetical protein